MITASSETIMRQAHMSANEYLDACITYIDAQFGSGYAKANPILVAAMIQASATDYGATTIAVSNQASSDIISGAIKNAAEQICESMQQCFVEYAEQTAS